MSSPTKSIAGSNLKENYFLVTPFFYFVSQAFTIVGVNLHQRFVRKSWRKLGGSICIYFLFSLFQFFLCPSFLPSFLLYVRGLNGVEIHNWAANGDVER